MGDAPARSRFEGPAHLRPPPSAAVVAAIAAVCTGCAVTDRETIVGRYERTIGGVREEWTLRDDGSCSIIRDGAAPPASDTCEWHLAEQDGDTVLAMEVRRTSGGSIDRVRYRLTPTRTPGGRVTIALGAGDDALLRKMP